MNRVIKINTFIMFVHYIIYMYNVYALSVQINRKPRSINYKNNSRFTEHI